MRRRHRRRNPISGKSFSRPLSLAAPVLTGAAGALTVNAIMNYAPLPDAMKQGTVLYLTRAGVALLLGIFGPRIPVVGRYAREAAIGSLIVTATDFGKLMALQNGVNLSGLGYIGPARVIPARPNGVGRFIAGNGNGNGARMRAPGVGMFVPRR